MENRKKYLMIGYILLIGMIIFLIVNLLLNENKTRNYVSIEATLLEKVSKSGATHQNRMNNHLYERYEFVVNNKKITAEKIGFFFSTKKEGNKYVIKYNPNNPTELENTYGNITSIMVLFLLIVSLLALLLNNLKNKLKNHHLNDNKQ